MINVSLKRMILPKSLRLAFIVPPIKVIVSHWISPRILRVIHLNGSCAWEHQEINGIIKFLGYNVSFLTEVLTPATVSTGILNVALCSPPNE